VRGGRLQPRGSGGRGRYFAGGVRAARELERLVTERAAPQEAVSDNGTELTSGAMLR